MTAKFYAGVGSRETPASVLAHMSNIAQCLGRQSYVLRTGGADGADDAFTQGARVAQAPRIILRPNNLTGSETALAARVREIAKRSHTAWSRCSDYAKALHMRNVQIVLGRELDAPAVFLICWTPDGVIDNRTSKATGGTGQAIRVAHAHSIPVWNLERSDHLAHWITTYKKGRTG